MTAAEEASELRERSGEVDSTDPVVALLYVLLRDHLPAADIEEAVQQVDKGDAFMFTNGWLARYAIDLRERLAGKVESKARARLRKENTL